MIPEYTYKAKVVKIVDADTIDLDISLGFGLWMEKQRLRLSGIDAPEVRGAEREEGLRSTEFVKQALAVGCEVVIKTEKDKKGSFGRWLATVYYTLDGKDWINLNEELVKQGLAEWT